MKLDFMGITNFQIHKNGQPTTMKIDFGAEGNVISEQNYNIIQPLPVLSKSKLPCKTQQLFFAIKKEKTSFDK